MVEMPLPFRQANPHLSASYPLASLTATFIWDNVLQYTPAPAASPTLTRDTLDFLSSLITPSRALDLMHANIWLAYLGQFPEPLSFDIDDSRFSRLWLQIRRVMATNAQFYWARMHWPFFGLKLYGPAEDSVLSDSGVRSINRALFQSRARLGRAHSHMRQNYFPLLNEVRRLISTGACDLRILLDPIFFAVPKVLHPPLPRLASLNESKRWVEEHCRPYLADGARGEVSLVLLCQRLDELEPWRRSGFVPLPHHHWFVNSAAIGLQSLRRIYDIGDVASDGPEGQEGEMEDEDAEEE
jgi:hypothetical protein